jgi:hypothetical protein
VVVGFGWAGPQLEPPTPVPRPLFDELRRWAEQEMRSINGQIEWVLRDAVRRHERRRDSERGDDPEADDDET